jgi:hypothetical protein
MQRLITGSVININMKISDIITETTAGAVATVAVPLGGMRKRPNPSVFTKKKKKTNEEIRPEKPNKSSEEYIAMGHAPDSDKVQRAKEYEEWAERQRAKGKDVDEGKSPHKKGTKKYKKHMAAMHAGG